MDYQYPEIDSVFHVKVMLCFILGRINGCVTEKQLYEIVFKSEVINYFRYAEALAELVENGSVSRKEEDGEIYLVLNDKGKMGSDYFYEYIPEYFHNKLLKSAFSVFAKIRNEKETDIYIYEIKNGYEVNCVIKDVSYDLLRISVYAPDIKEAEVIRENILKSPGNFYRNVIDCAINNKADEFKGDLPSV